MKVPDMKVPDTQTTRLIHVPVPASARDTSLSGLHGPDRDHHTGECEQFGRCDRDACLQTQRVELRCPSLEPTAGPA